MAEKKKHKFFIIYSLYIKILRLNDN